MVISRFNPPLAAFPQNRPRRLRQKAWIRDMVAENRLVAADFIYPLFVLEGEKSQDEVASLPGVQRRSIDLWLPVIEECCTLGIPTIALFPVTPSDRKTEDAREAWNPDNIVARSCQEIKKRFDQIGIMADVALDPYSSHGQDGIVRDGTILNDETLIALQKQAVSQAAAGCDILGPSDMMDGRIGAVRDALDEAGFYQTAILSYAAKYASSFYGPFRDAVGSSANLGKADKKTYQMDPANALEALREVALDISEGADMVMVKPGLPYLDIVRGVKEAFGLPTAAYHVSGEYAMIKAAGQQGWIDGDACMMESLLAFKRAGADMILTYAALDVAGKLKT